jgi:hypothetical protein
MPSVLHEVLVSLFRERPTLAGEVLVQSLGASIRSFDEVRIESSELGDVVPTEYRADLVVVFYDDAGKALLAVAVEVQLREDSRKRFTWPIYATTLRGRYECEAVVLVVAATENVAAWAAEPIVLGPSGTIHPLVLSPSSVPKVTDESVASRAPELAVLSAIAHANAVEASAIAVAAIRAVRSLDDQWAWIYADLIGSRLNDAARAALEAEMQKYEPQSPWGKRHFEEGREQGREQGREEGHAESVLLLLEESEIAVPDEARARILACRDLPTITRWLRRAASAKSVDDVFDD